jgi:uncharacterized protein YxjI
MRPHWADHGRIEDASAQRYQMHEQLLGIGDNYWIETNPGIARSRSTGRQWRLRATFPDRGPEARGLAM